MEGDDKMNKKTVLDHVFLQLTKKNDLSVDDYKSKENVIVQSDKVFFEMDTFGNNVVMRVDPQLFDWCIKKFKDEDPKNMMDGAVLYDIETKLRTYGYRLSGEHLRFLFLEDKHIEPPKGYTYKVYYKEDLHLLAEYKEFGNALNFKSDVIAVGAFYDGVLVSLAGADDYMVNLWQVGIDTLTDHRGKGLGKYIVKMISDEILKQSAIPYYTTWCPNIASMNVAIGAGYIPLWLGYYAEKNED